MAHFTILLAGPVEASEALRRRIAGTRVIAADEGMRHATSLGLLPELWVGDFDSAAPSFVDDYPGVEREAFPPEKDKTDGELAVEAAIRRGANALTFVGAFGGLRTDHLFMHLVLATGLRRKGFQVELTSGRETGWPIGPGRHRFDLEAGRVFSILPFTALRGLSIRNAQYPLRDVAVPFGSLLTLSNVALGPVEIHLEEGDAVLLAQDGP